MQHALKMQYISLLPKYIKSICRGLFQHEFTYVNAVFKKLSPKREYTVLLFLTRPKT